MTQDPIIRREFQTAIRGIPARNHGATIGGKGYRDGTFTMQKISLSRRDPADSNLTIRVQMRFDDNCRNGHNDFAITGEIVDKRERRDGGIVACGCIHEDIARVFPELADLIQWHLCSTDGPMHYVANTVYMASDRDVWGRKAGEASAWSKAIVFGDNPIHHKVPGKFWQFLHDAAAHPGRGRFDFEVISIDHGDRGKPGKYQFDPKYTFGGFGTAWHECPFETEGQAMRFLEALQRCEPRFIETPTAYSEGKARDLDGARRAAIWPEATDAELMADKAELTAALQARLPDLITRFRATMEEIGFLWQPPATVND